MSKLTRFKSRSISKTNWRTTWSCRKSSPCLTMTRYGFVVVGSSGAVGGFAGLSPKAASRSASKKPPSCVNDMRRVEGVEHHTLQAQRYTEARGRRRPFPWRRRLRRLRRRRSRLRPSNRESNERRRQGGFKHGRRRSRRVEAANHNVGVERTGNTPATDERGCPERPEALPQFLLLLECSPLLVFGACLRLQDADDELLLGSQCRIHVGRCFG